MFNINPFRKKQRFQEAQGGGEPYFPPDLERFRAQPAEPSILEIPERERKFKAFAREIENRGPPEREFAYQAGGNIGTGFGEERKETRDDRFSQSKPIDNADKMDMVLQKLETIDLRLKLIEQKMERRPI